MIPFFFANASGGTVCSLDDPNVDTDFGSQFTASLASVPFVPQPPEGESRLRRLVQALKIGTSATVKLTPICDESENPDDTQTFNFASTTDGADPEAVAGTANTGDRFQMKVEVTSHVGSCELADAQIWTVQRRSVR